MNNFLIRIKRLIYGFQHQTKETIWKYMNNLIYDPTIYSTEVTEIEVNPESWTQLKGSR